MKRTHATVLIGLGLAGVVIGYLLELALVASSAPSLIPPLTFPITLVVIGGIVVGFAIPIRRATRGKATRRIDPFVAMRVAVLAKACSLAGALLTGFGIGIVVNLVTRTVIPSGDALWLSVAASVGAALLLAAGLVAEHMCMLPPEDGDESRQHHD